MSEVIKALREASISVACGLDDGVLYRKDIEHIQKQITIGCSSSSSSVSGSRSSSGSRHTLTYRNRLLRAVKGSED